MCGYDGMDIKIDRWKDEMCPRCDSPSCCWVNSRRYHRYRKLWESETTVLDAIDCFLLVHLWRMDVGQAREKLRGLYSDRLVRAMEPEQRISHIKNEMWSFIENGLEDISPRDISPTRPWLPARERRELYRKISLDRFLRYTSVSSTFPLWSRGLNEDDFQSNFVICNNWHKSYFDDDWDGCKECAEEFDEYISDPEGWRERWEERRREQGRPVSDLAFFMAWKPTDPSEFDFDNKELYGLDMGRQFQLIDHRV